MNASTIELLGAGTVLLVMIGVGTAAHELTHAAVLRFLGVPFDVEWGTSREASQSLGVGVSTALVAVVPRSIPGGVSSLGLRLAALAPLVLAIPGVFVLAGVLPDPLALGEPLLTAATVAWFACALPSPRDFSLFWYAERVVEGGV